MFDMFDPANQGNMEDEDVSASKKAKLAISREASKGEKRSTEGGIPAPPSKRVRTLIQGNNRHLVLFLTSSGTL